MTIRPIAPVRLGKGGVHLAQGMRAGPWIFATGAMAQDFASGIAPEVAAPANPHGGAPRHQKEAALVYRHLDAVLREGGGGFGGVVRLDQYYTAFEAVDGYHPIRRAHFGPQVPPSTSIVMDGFALPGAEINVQLLAVAADAPFAPEPLDDPALRGPATSGYVPALRAGDLVFLAGALPMARRDEPHRHGLALAATRGEGAMWGRLPIELQADYVVREKIVPALALAGATLDDVLKAQVYLTHLEDAAAFNEVWLGHVGDRGPATSIIPCRRPGLAVEAARVEINVVARCGGAAVVRHAVDADLTLPHRGQPGAVRAGDLVFLSGLMAADRDGLLDAARTDAGHPHYGDDAESQATAIIDRAARLCAAAGTELGDVVRVIQFQTDLADTYAIHRAWQRALPGRPIPFTTVGVPALPVPGARVLMDIWAYAP